MNLLSAYVRAKGDYDPTRLTRTGPGSGLSNPGLSDRPLAAYLEASETPHYVLEASATPAVVTAGESLSHPVGGYAAFLAVTSWGVRCVLGGPGGDAAVAVPYADIDEVGVAEPGSRVPSRERGVVTVRAAETTVAFETDESRSLPVVRRFVASRLADATAEQETDGEREDDADEERESGLPHPYDADGDDALLGAWSTERGRFAPEPPESATVEAPRVEPPERERAGAVAVSRVERLEPSEPEPVEPPKHTEWAAFGTRIDVN